MKSTRDELMNFFREVKHPIPANVFDALMVVFVTFLTSAQRMGVDMVKLPEGTDEELVKAFEEYKTELKSTLGKN